MFEPAGIRITLIDDDPAVCESISLALKLAGFQVTCFGSSTEAFEQVKQAPPQCLVLDLRMPKLDGLRFVEGLHVLGFAVPTVLISGNFDSTTRAQAADLGITELLVKPFSTNRLQDAIKTVMAGPEASL